MLLGGFGMRPKATMRFRALPMGQEAVAMGHEVTLVMPPWDCPEDAGREWTESGVRVVNVPLPMHITQSVGGAATVAPGIVRALVRAVRAAKPDIVHLFQPKGYGGLAALALTLRHVPLVVDVDDWEGAGGWNDMNAYSPMQRRLFAWQEHDLPCRAGACTVASRVLAARVASFGVVADRVTYLPNALASGRHESWAERAVSSTPAAVLQFRLGRARPKILVYTRFMECTPEAVAAVFARVRAQLPDACLFIVGGSDAARAAFASFGDAVSWAGDVPFAELPVYLQAADVALVPFADTPVNRAKCSVKTLDLLALGVPVVATAVGENVTMIRDGETGVLVPPDDAGAAASTLIALLTDAPQRRSLGAAARERAWREQTWAAQMPALLAAYRSVLTRPANRRSQ